MKRNDVIIISSIIVFLTFLVVPVTHRIVFGLSDDYPIIGGFIKFFLLASLGDLISHRIIHKNYQVKGMIYKALIWGIIGVIIVLVFPLYFTGVQHLQESGLLPFAQVALVTALLTSVLMNITFAPTMMAFHRITDHYIEHRIDDSMHRLKTSINAIDWGRFVDQVVFKTIPLFWIPAHTITFMLPGVYRVLFASFLGIALGLFLGLAKSKPRKV